MLKIEFTGEAIQALNYERYQHPHPRIQRKMEALWLKSQGLAHRDICRLTGICDKTLQRYLHVYQEGGVEGLKAVNFYQPSSALQPHVNSLETYFREHPPARLKEAMATLEELTGIRRSTKRVRKFLAALGIKRRKVGMIPAKADADQPTLFWLLFWDLFGASPGFFSRHPVGVNASMS